MYPIIEVILVTIYVSLLMFIFFYSLVQTGLVFNYLRKRKKTFKESDLIADVEDDSLPYVTIQLPIFNERYVVERLIDAVANFSYPRSKLEIQVLDDSTDDSIEITSAKIKETQKLGLDIVHIRRTNRQGFKAGALAEGLKICKGEYVAIFDADFLPNPDFLLKTVPYFKDDKIGLVQTKWEHLNEDYSLLTRLQAFGLNAHFTVEQGGRNYAGHFMNFNGTAGIWRKECINDAGGWSSDTLTEDLDLSYRAQIAGWKFKYLEKVGSPAELPAVMNALKTQQFRWTKGAAECTRKNLKRILKADNLSSVTKLHGAFHLMNSFLFLCIIITSLLSVQALLLKNNTDGSWITEVFKYGSFFLVSLLMLSLFYWVSMSSAYENKWKAIPKFIIKFPMFLSVSMGLSLHNAIAVIEGYAGVKSPFIRTPKFNIVEKSDSWGKNKYLKKGVSYVTIMEGLLTIYFAAGIILGFHYGDMGLMPFHIMLTIGFGIVFYYSIVHSRSITR